MFPTTLKASIASVALLAALIGTTVRAQSSPVKNIVLVHGAWADGSGWKGVYDILVKDGYNVSIVQDPLLLTGFLPVANRVQTGFGAKPLNWRINIRT